MPQKPEDRDYKKEYRRDQSSPARKKYRAELSRKARAMGHYGKTPKGKDLIHKNGEIVGLGDRKANRADGARKATMARMKARRKRKKAS
jgi:hypothetical protein